MVDLALVDQDEQIRNRRAAFEEAVRYSSDRKVFGQAVAEYPLSLAKIAKMAANIAACRAFTHEVAGLMDRGEGAMEDSAVWVRSSG